MLALVVGVVVKYVVSKSKLVQGNWVRQQSFCPME